jgi:hypothetical protein
MRISLAWRKDRPLDGSLAWVCVATNQLVTPGLGSIVAGRIRGGLIQLSAALAGFTLIMLWFFQLFRILLREGELGARLIPHAWMWKWGLVLFGSGWALALISSVGILREARRNESGKPPKLSR